MAFLEEFVASMQHSPARAAIIWASLTILVGDVLSLFKPRHFETLFLDNPISRCLLLESDYCQVRLLFMVLSTDRSIGCIDRPIEGMQTVDGTLHNQDQLSQQTLARMGL